MGLLMSVHYLIYITSCRSLMEKNRPVMVLDTVAAKFHTNKLHANKKKDQVKKSDEELTPAAACHGGRGRGGVIWLSKMEGWKECMKEGNNKGKDKEGNNKEGINNGNNKEGKKKKGNP